MSKQKNQTKQTFFNIKEEIELMKFLTNKFPEKKRTAIKSLLSNKQISINYQQISQFNHLLKKGDELIVSWDKMQRGFSHKSIDIIFEDPYIMVVYKHAGLLSVASLKESNRTVLSILKEQVQSEDPKNKIYAVNRLDREISGLMVFAKTSTIKRKLQDILGSEESTRKFTALVNGSVEKNRGTIRSYLKENSALIMYSSLEDNGGKYSVTHYKTIKRSKFYSLLELKLETGRKNQIRVHMQDIGHSVVGDKKYGDKKNPISRIALDANYLEFLHPVTGKKIKFESKTPAKFLSLSQDENNTKTKK
jgi:23S rRNA pseudouridine1911/1915/1917 synthase